MHSNAAQLSVYSKVHSAVHTSFDNGGNCSGWEEVMLRLLRSIRAKETSYAIRMARIRAFNMALYFFITPLVSFIVFTVVCCKPSQHVLSQERTH